MLDLIIIGGGPAGAAAGVYAARKRLKTLLLTIAIGGQSTDSMGIENWIGTPKIAGPDLANLFEKHLTAAKGDALTVMAGERVVAVAKKEKGFAVKTTRGSYVARALLIASGASRRKLPVEGADKFENKGLTYCASCDGPLFAGQNVAVVGGGNAGFETAAQLLAYCPSVTLLHRRDTFKADEVTVEKVLAAPNMHVLKDVEPTAVVGENFVSGLSYKSIKTGEEATLPVAGIFVEIGSIPNADFAKDLVTLDEFGRITVDPKNQRASAEGIWAAGDVTDELYHQNNIAAGDGVKALEDIYMWLAKNP